MPDTFRDFVNDGHWAILTKCETFCCLYARLKYLKSASLVYSINFFHRFQLWLCIGLFLFFVCFFMRDFWTVNNILYKFPFAKVLSGQKCPIQSSGSSCTILLNMMTFVSDSTQTSCESNLKTFINHLNHVFKGHWGAGAELRLADYLTAHSCSHSLTPNLKLQKACPKIEHKKRVLS